jgi:hypothetical protein
VNSEVEELASCTSIGTRNSGDFMIVGAIFVRRSMSPDRVQHTRPLTPRKVATPDTANSVLKPAARARAGCEPFIVSTPLPVIRNSPENPKL